MRTASQFCLQPSRGCMRAFSLVCTAACLAMAPLLFFGEPSLHAQEAAAPPAHISFVDGSATLDRNGELESAAVNMPLLQGDRLRTANGRIEVMFPDGSAIEIDHDSEVEFLSTTRVRVLAGAIEHRAAAAPYDSPSASPTPSTPPAWSPPPTAGQPVSTEYLPSELRTYGQQFDQYGAWQYEAPYGYVWYPSVAVDWRPYYYGYWSSVPAYGWTWIGYDPWAWPTHHYGRWGFGHSRWFWIPGRTFAAAWVSWGTASDYVSWCPLGFDGGPVAAFSVGYRPAWNAWTFVPRDRFGWRGYPVHRYAVEPYRIASSTPFIVHREAPPVRGFAAGAAASSRPSAGATQQYAVPRYTAPGRPSSAGAPAAPGAAVPRYNARQTYPTVQRPSAAQQQFPSGYRPSPGYRDYRPPAGYARPVAPPQAPAFTRQGQSAFTRQPPPFRRESPPAFTRQGPPAFTHQSPPAFTREGPPTFTRQGPPAFTRQSPPAFTRQSPPAFSRESAPMTRPMPPPRAPSPPPHAMGDAHGSGGHAERAPSRSSSEGTAVRRGR